MKRSQDKGRRVAARDRQAVESQRTVEHEKRRRDRSLGFCGGWRKRQCRQQHVVLAIESGEALRAALTRSKARRAKVTTHQPIPIKRVEAELVDVESAGE